MFEKVINMFPRILYIRKMIDPITGTVVSDSLIPEANYNMETKPDN